MRARRPSTRHPFRENRESFQNAPRPVDIDGDHSLPRLSCSSLHDRGPKVGDALELVRLQRPTARSFCSVKAGVKRGLFSRSARYWVELRGHIVLLMRDGPSGPVSALFSVLGCHLTTGGTARSPVLRIQKAKSEASRAGVPSSYVISMRFECTADSENWMEALSLAYEQRIVGVSDFEFVSPIGRGASGKVFLVRDRASGRKLALKVIDKNKVYQNPSSFSHVVHERLALQLVAGHPFFTRLRYAFQTRSNFYLAIDFYEGGDLYQYLRTHHGRLAEPQARIVCSEVALALDHLHRLGFVYRDLKPENVLLDLQGHIRLADFGLCKMLPADRLTSTVCGTHTYAAPEMLSSQPYGTSVDLWAFGTFLYHVLRGRTPYEARDLDQVIANMNNKRIRFSSNTSPELVHLIKQLLDWNPDTRFGCGREGMDQVRRHPFFKGVNWRSIYNRDDNPDGLLRYSQQQKMRCVETSIVYEGCTSAGESTIPSISPSSRDRLSASADFESSTGQNTGMYSSSGSGEMDDDKKKNRVGPQLAVPERSAASNLKPSKPAAASLWDGMVAAAGASDHALRNFDMLEFGKISVSLDADAECETYHNLWPLMDAREAFEDGRNVIGFAFSATSLGLCKFPINL